MQTSTRKTVLPALVVLLAWWCFGLEESHAQSVEIPANEGIGTLFQQGEITVLSEAEISLTFGAADQHFVDLTVSSTAASVSVMVSGLSPSTSYYVYLDDYSNLEEHTTDEDGSLPLSFLLVEPYAGLPNLRHVLIQDERSTLFLRDDATGGDCTSVGTWDALTKTCTLTQTVTETTQVDADGVTLDCAGHIIQKGTGFFGVLVGFNTDDITVKNCNVQGSWSFGISTNSSPGARGTVGRRVS